MSSTLLSLPTELLLVIIDAPQDQKSLLNLVLTCRLARLLAEPILYRSIVITAGSQAKCLAGALRSQERSDFVASLEVVPDYYKETDIEALTPTIGTMSHLRSLSMESPFINYQRWSYTGERWRDLLQGYRLLFSEAARGIGLQNLESLTIHWAGDENRFWRLTEISSIFKLPALRRLTLSSAALLDDLIEHLTDLPAGTTPLTHLDLLQCFVTPKAISAVLALPRALRSCHLGNLRHQEFQWSSDGRGLSISGIAGGAGCFYDPVQNEGDACAVSFWGGGPEGEHCVSVWRGGRLVFWFVTAIGGAYYAFW
ncbi:hypothetical protein FB45DRAFT_942590 [Roridomyces roridus]|uniref:F-box domain-containing protein n=1 Tax=Roridomyces roridus TaxID=1738132 RepID=A0AAD7B5M4_9AGAR|nr:hypothetical protein FB45DRAFT_942590 [Roridomyces roridus]